MTDTRHSRRDAIAAVGAGISAAAGSVGGSPVGASPVGGSRVGGSRVGGSRIGAGCPGRHDRPTVPRDSAGTVLYKHRYLASCCPVL